MRIKPIFAWYDLWVGAFWDSAKRRLYLFPVPMLGVVIQFKPRSASDYRSPEFRFWDRGTRELKKIGEEEGLELKQGGGIGIEGEGFCFKWNTSRLIDNPAYTKQENP